jgi:AbrB family looped-hinge helix DNA binding protein
MNELRTKMTENGRIVIPAAFRKQLHFQPGEELIIRIDNDELRVFSIKHSLEKARALVSKHTKNKSLVQKLKALRKEDLENE